MSNPSTIYDRLITEITSVLSTYQRLPNPYDVTENPSIIMNKSFGIAYMGGSDPKIYATCKLSELHNYDIIIVHQVNATDHQTTAKDTVVKAMLDDMHTVVEWFLANQTLNGLAMSVEVGDQSGIEYVQGETARHYKLTRSLDIRFTD